MVTGEMRTERVHGNAGDSDITVSSDMAHADVSQPLRCFGRSVLV